MARDHSKNFETLKRAIQEGNACVMDCILRSSDEHVAVICAMNHDGKEVEMVPLCMFFNGNPYRMLESPLQYGDKG